MAGPVLGFFSLTDLAPNVFTAIYLFSPPLKQKTIIYIQNVTDVEVLLKFIETLPISSEFILLSFLNFLMSHRSSTPPSSSFRFGQTFTGQAV